MPVLATGMTFGIMAKAQKARVYAFLPKEAVASVVENALDNAKQEKGGIANSSTASAPGLKEKFQSAFAEENFVIKL